MARAFSRSVNLDYPPNMRAVPCKKIVRALVLLTAIGIFIVVAYRARTQEIEILSGHAGLSKIEMSRINKAKGIYHDRKKAAPFQNVLLLTAITSDTLTCIEIGLATPRVSGLSGCS